GHEDTDKEAPLLDYKALAKIGTLVIMMGVGTLPSIAAALLAAGREPETPAACIERGTTSKQRTITGTLATIADRASQANLRAPAIIVIGQVAALHESLRWWDESEQRENR